MTARSSWRARMTSRWASATTARRNAFIVYADLECILEKTEKTSNHKYQYHRVLSIAYYIHCSTIHYLFIGFVVKDCVAWFTEEFRVLTHSVQSILFTNVSMTDFTRDDWEKFNSATHYQVCKKSFALDDTQVRHYYHLTSWYRDHAHSSYNINYKNLHCSPVVFHNLSGYDAHFIIKEIATVYEG